MKSALSFVTTLMPVVLVACYGSRAADEPQGDTADNSASGAAGGSARGDATSGDRPSYPAKSAPGGTTARPAPRTGASSGGTGGVSGGAGQCAALRTPENDRIYIDQDAFSGIGGAGAMLAGTCKRCGWDSRSEMCQTLVASVPTITNSNYYACLDLSVEFGSCLEVESCVCGGKVPARCAAIKAKQDACLNSMAGPDDADGGMETTESWMDVQTMCGFGFKAPANYRTPPVQGTDSCVVEFTAADCKFFADYGSYSGWLSQNPGDLNYRDGVTQVDGRYATIATYTTADPTRYAAALHVPEISQDSPGTKLTIVATCQSESGQYDAQVLFGTIHFD